MSEPWEWEEADLQSLVDNQARENLNLDFKACAALDKGDGKKRELSKDASAFANSAGGTLVYGIIEDKKTHTAKALDGGYDPSEIGHEWVEQVINSNIQPRIVGLRVKAVRLQISNPGKVAYVVHVPQSMTAHQAADKRYYKRFNFESVPMEDYEIRDTMHRALEPRVTVSMTVDGQDTGATKFIEEDDEAFTSPVLAFYVANELGAAVAEYLQAQIFVADSIRVHGVPFMLSRTTVHLPGGMLRYGYIERTVSRENVPLFSGERRLIAEFKFSVASTWKNDVRLPFILWRTRSNNTSPKHGAVVFTQLVAGYWQFRPATIDGLPEGYSADFSP